MEENRKKNKRTNNNKNQSFLPDFQNPKLLLQSEKPIPQRKYTKNTDSQAKKKKNLKKPK
jgi:hypothetical protein